MHYSEVKAYYEDCGEKTVSEPLLQHLRGVGDILAGADGAVLARYLRRRHGLGDDFINYLALAGYLHDIGKAVITRVWRGRCIRYSFKGHEAVSAYIVARLVREAEITDDIIAAAPVFAVLYHHHAMSTEKRIEIEDLKKIKPQVRSAGELANLIAEAIKPLPRSMRSNLEGVVPTAAEEVMSDLEEAIAVVSSEIDDWLWYAAASKEGGFAILTASVAALVAADYVTGASARTSPRSGFSAAALGFARYYLGVEP